MRIFIASSYYWPEPAGNAPYVTGVAEHLASVGHDVVVATGFPHYPAWLTPPRRLAQREERNGVRICRRWHYVPRHQSALTRGAYEATLLTLGATAIPARRPDVVLAVVPTIAAAVVARLAAFAHRRPYGLVFQDLIGLAATQSGVVGGHRIAGVVARAEIALARNAEGVGVITNGFGTYLRARGVAPSRITRLRNWSQDVTPTRSREEVRLAFGWGNDTFVCVHAGNIGHKQGLENVLAAAGLLRARPILFVLAGDGNERPRLERLAAERQLTNVVFLPPSPPGEYEALLRAADLLLVNQRASVGEMSLASKLTSYFAAGRPVLAAVAPASETARELTNANGGLLVAPDDPDALADAVGRLAGNEQQAAAYQDNSLEYVRTRLAPQVVLPEYEKFVAKLARRAP